MIRKIILIFALLMYAAHTGENEDNQKKEIEKRIYAFTNIPKFISCGVGGNQDNLSVYEFKYPERQQDKTGYETKTGSAMLKINKISEKNIKLLIPTIKDEKAEEAAMLIKQQYKAYCDCLAKSFGLKKEIYFFGKCKKKYCDVKCSFCGGEGKNATRICRACKGTGKMITSETDTKIISKIKSLKKELLDEKINLENEKKELVEMIFGYEGE
jgi:hypothetical protein